LDARACAPCRAAHSHAMIHMFARLWCGRRTCKSATVRFMALSLDDLPNDVEKLKVMLLAISAETEAAQAETEAALAENAKLVADHARLDHEHTVLSAEVDRTRQQNERLEHIINVLRRAHFGRKSERTSVEQMALVWLVETFHPRRRVRNRLMRSPVFARTASTCWASSTPSSTSLTSSPASSSSISANTRLRTSSRPCAPPPSHWRRTRSSHSRPRSPGPAVRPW
jgi:deoxyribodipyrimidine photolyase